MNEPQLTVAPTEQAVTLGEVYTQLRITENDEDDYLEGLIDVATTVLQAKAWWQFLTATYTLKFTQFCTEMRLPRPPLKTVTGITYVDANGDSQTVTSSIYDVITYQTPGLIRLAYQQNWPSDLRGHPDDITVTFTCGEAASDVPDRTKQAIKLFVAHMYTERTPVVIGRSLNSVEVPMGIMFLLERAGMPV